MRFRDYESPTGPRQRSTLSGNEPTENRLGTQPRLVLLEALTGTEYGDEARIELHLLKALTSVNPEAAKQWYYEHLQDTISEDDIVPNHSLRIAKALSQLWYKNDYPR